jgi:hypothetical protein
VGAGVVAPVEGIICQEISMRRARRLGEACAEIPPWTEKRVEGCLFVIVATYRSRRILTRIEIINFCIVVEFLDS